MQKTELGQIFTNMIVADYMVEMFSLEKDASILDPCFGEGVFLDSLRKHGYSNVIGCELDNELYSSAITKFQFASLYCADFLEYNSNLEISGIIMNPPYIRQEKINDLEPYGITKSKIKKNLAFQKLPQNANMYMYFVVKALEILRNNGELVVIFPSSWIDAKGGMTFKNYLFTEYDIVQKTYISGDVFQNNALVDVVIMKIIKRQPLGNSRVEYKRVSKNKIIDIDVKTDAVADFNFKNNLLDYATVRRGLTTGYNKLFINPIIGTTNQENVFPIISTPKNVNGYSTKGAQMDSVIIIEKEETVSNEVMDYINKFKAEIINEKKPKALYDKINKNEVWYSLKKFDSKGIIFSYFVRDDMKFIMNESEAIIRDNFYIIRPKIDQYLLFALLNNYCTYYQLELSGKKYGAGLLKLQRYDIEDLLFPNINSISENDKKKLYMLAKKIIENGNIQIIEEISKIIANYSNMSFDVIKEKYFNEKHKRLGLK